MYLKLENIRKEYDGHVAVENLSLDVPEGVIYGIIGPNGAGKTTTIRMLMNIIAPDSGRILINGSPPGDEFRDTVGYLPEERGLYKKMTLREVITYMAELKGFGSHQSGPLIDPWLDKMGLLEYKERKVEELSKGMAQKLQFITTILHDPDLIILDELFSVLDPVNIELIKNVLLDLKRQNKTILFSTHVMEQAEKLCDYLCMISHGKKVLDGRLSDVKAKFGKNSLQIEIEGDGSFVNALPGVRSMTEHNNYLEIKMEDGGSPHDILKAVIERVTVRRFEVVEPSLYDIFIETAHISASEFRSVKGEISRA